MSRKSASVDAECRACRGTGIYSGMAEPKGVGVVCLQCDGSGKHVIDYTPFTERKRRSDINTVRQSQGMLIAFDVGPIGSSISYQEFLEGKMPTRK